MTSRALTIALFILVAAPVLSRGADVGFAEVVTPYDFKYLLFTPDDKHLIAFTHNAAVQVWEIRTGKRVQTLWLPRNLVGSHYQDVDISPDSRRLAIPCGTHFLVIDLAGERVTAIGRGHKDQIADLAFSPDGKTVATVGADRRLKLWDPADGTCRATFTGLGEREFYALAWSPDGKSIATLELDGPLRLWDAGTGRVRDLTRETIFGYKLLWRPDGKVLAVLHHPAEWLVLDLSGRTLLKDEGYRWNLAAARFDSEGRFAIPPKGGKTEEFQLVDATTGLKAGPCPGHPRVGRIYAVSASGDLCAYYGPDDELVVRSLIDGKVRMRTPGRSREAAKAVGWSADGKSLLWTARRDGPFPKPAPPTERAFDLTELKLAAAPTDAKRTVAKLKDEKREITGGSDYYFTLTRRKSRESVSLEPSGMSDSFLVRAATLLAGERAAVISDWGLALHDTETGKELFYYTPFWGWYGLAPSPDGRFFATDGDTIGVYATDGPDCLLALHVVGDRWVAWTGDGYYACSWDAALPVGRFIDHGPDRLGEFVPLNRLKGRYRPDVIGRLLSAGSLEKALKAPAPRKE